MFIRYEKMRYNHFSIEGYMNFNNMMMPVLKSNNFRLLNQILRFIKMDFPILIFLILFISQNNFAQHASDKYFQGYVNEVSGKRFGYHSPFPDVNTSLLLRGQADYAPIVWETEVVPETYDAEYVNFIWVFGRDVDSNPVTFNLYVNDLHWFSFESSKTSTTGFQEIPGRDGSRLIFNVTMLDKYEDQMGFAILKLPASAVNSGKPNQLKIDAVPEENNAWIMTYKTSVHESVEIYQNKVVVKDSGKLFHSISVDFIHVGSDTKAEIRIGDIVQEIILKAGYNKSEINLPKVVEQEEFSAEIKIGKQTLVHRKFTLSPIREWEIYFVQHTHTDIGYTRPQTEILPEHLKYIDQALDYCDLTDHYPDAAKFRWTCETSWSVREYLKSRPQEQIDRFLKRLQEGRIEATGMFFNFSEIIDESALAAQTKTLRMLKNSGVDVSTAMQNDVNGIAWCLVDYFHNTNVKYLDMGIHAHRARLPFDKPTSFWWQSPAGNRLLAYRSEHYQHGNTLSLTTGQQDVLRTNLSNYLTGLEEKDYPYNKISLQFSGYITDNSPPSTKVCDIIKEWNEKYEWPKLRNALASEFLIFIDEQHANEIPVHEVAWPDWWTDGTGSAANETKVVRNTQAEISSTTALLSMALLMGANLPGNINEEITEVYDNLLFYDEHTHGAAESVSDPLSQNTINQWNMKSAYAWEAAKKSSMLKEKALAYIEHHIQKSNKPAIAVFNTLNWPRSGLVDIFMGYELIPEDAKFTITDEEATNIPVQVLQRRMEGAYYQLWVENIPPIGYKTLNINLDTTSERIDVEEKDVFENNFYRIDIDESNGVVTRIFDKELQKDIVDRNDTLSLGQLVYEELENRHDLERLTASNRDTVYRPLNLTRTILSNIQNNGIKNGSIYTSLILHGDLPVCADNRGVDIEIRLFHYQKKIEFHYRMVKLPVLDPEGVYVSFPFYLEKGKLAFEAQGGIVYPGKNQLAGTSSDWNTIQNFAAVQSSDAQIVFCSKDIPLVHFGDFNIGRYYYHLQPKTNHIYSWVLNNYWVTNFKASQQGELRWSYAITSSDDNSNVFATKFGWSQTVPLHSRIISAKAKAGSIKQKSRTLIDIDIPNLVLVNACPSVEGRGVVLHVREIEGDHAILDIRRLKEETGAISIEEVNILEEKLAHLSSPLLIEHFETKFIRLNFD